MYDDDQQPGPAVASFHDKQATSSGISDCSPNNGEQASKRLRLRKVQNTDNNGHDNESASLRTRLRKRIDSQAPQDTSRVHSQEIHPGDEPYVIIGHWLNSVDPHDQERCASGSVDQVGRFREDDSFCVSYGNAGSFVNIEGLESAPNATPRGPSLHATNDPVVHAECSSRERHWQASGHRGRVRCLDLAGKSMLIQHEADLASNDDVESRSLSSKRRQSSFKVVSERLEVTHAKHATGHSLPPSRSSRSIQRMLQSCIRERHFASAEAFSHARRQIEAASYDRNQAAHAISSRATLRNHRLSTHLLQVANKTDVENSSPSHLLVQDPGSDKKPVSVSAQFDQAARTADVGWTTSTFVSSLAEASERCRTDSKQETPGDERTRRVVAGSNYCIRSQSGDRTKPKDLPVASASIPPQRSNHEKHRDDFEWDHQRQQFLTYYIEYNQRLPEAAKTMAQLHGFNATLEQWRHHLRQWRDAGLLPPGTIRRPLRLCAAHGNVAHDVVAEELQTLTNSVARSSERGSNVSVVAQRMPIRTVPDRVAEGSITGNGSGNVESAARSGTSEGIQLPRLDTLGTLDMIDIESGIEATCRASRWRDIVRNSGRELIKRPVMSVTGLVTVVLTGLQLSQKA